MPCYLEHTASATTFADLFSEYLFHWPEAFCEVLRSGPTSKGYADHLLRRAHAVADEFPRVELWDVLERALWHSMKWYDARKGTFEKLFEHNLRERLRKATARSLGAATRAARLERLAVVGNTQARRDADLDGVAAGYERWSVYLLGLAAERL